jgi:hypothetical protein
MLSESLFDHVTLFTDLWLSTPSANCPDPREQNRTLANEGSVKNERTGVGHAILGVPYWPSIYEYPTPPTSKFPLKLSALLFDPSQQ